MLSQARKRPHLDQQAAVTQLARNHIHMAVAQEHPEALRAPP